MDVDDEDESCRHNNNDGLLYVHDEFVFLYIIKQDEDGYIIYFKGILTHTNTQRPKNNTIKCI